MRERLPMSLRTACVIALSLSLLILAGTGPAYCQTTAVLSVCQELVSSARAYEARSTAHNRIAKSLMAQIESLAKLPKSDGTIAAMDSLFSQYDENRALENKFRTLYRQSTDESERCMKSAN
jgi:hypothetical protein